MNTSPTINEAGYVGYNDEDFAASAARLTLLDELGALPADQAEDIRIVIEVAERRSRLIMDAYRIGLDLGRKGVDF
ncbi:MAG: hypothetical protein M3237_23675 [Actinomycetota bacterium]|nr:hypothetical protein [Actinomycetota bacterium]